MSHDFLQIRKEKLQYLLFLKNSVFTQGTKNNMVRFWWSEVKGKGRSDPLN